jgi:2'-5' RNA ligase
MWYRTATKEVHTGVMIAFYVPSAVAKQIKLNKKDIGSNSRIESARELHMTLAFLGDKTGISDKKPDIINALKTFAKKSHTISGKISGVGLFSNQESDGN